MTALRVNRTRRNRLVTQVEDIVYTAMVNLADREEVTISQLIRDMIISDLARQDLLTEPTLQALIGIRK